MDLQYAGGRESGRWCGGMEVKAFERSCKVSGISGGEWVVAAGQGQDKDSGVKATIKGSGGQDKTGQPEWTAISRINQGQLI